jgi:2'-5' RNA ligase
MTTAHKGGEWLENHWSWRPEWGIDRPCLMWYLTFENQPGLWHHAVRIQGRLATVTSIDPVPTPWLHLTVHDVGFVDETPPDRVDDLVQLARSATDGWRAPTLHLGPVSTMGTALVLRAGPVDRLSDLRDRLRACTAVAIGPDRAGGPRVFSPHVSVGYANGHSEVARVLEPIADLAEQQLIVSVPRLTLASVTRRNRHYQWVARATLDLEAVTAVGEPVG